MMAECPECGREVEEGIPAGCCAEYFSCECGATFFRSLAGVE